MVTLASTKDFALWYASLGIAVFPIFEMRPDGACSCGGLPQCEPGKHPRVQGAYLAGTTDVKTIETWWTANPASNIGASMAQSRLLCVDIDPKHDGDEHWYRMCQELELPVYPETWTNLTGSGGRHYYWRVPTGFDCVQRSLARGVDIRWKGYAILPPSNHVSGGMYTWEVDAGPEDGRPAPIPRALLERLQHGTKEERAAGENPRGDVGDLLTVDVPEGRRHDVMHSILSWMRNLMPQGRCEALALAWNAAHCSPPLPDDEVRRHIAWVYANYAEPAKGTLEEEAPALPRNLIRGTDLRVMQIPPIAWVVEDMLPVGRYAVLSGESGLGKSWWALALALCCWLEQPFLGRQTTKARTLYIDEENGIQEAQRRLRALADGLGIPEGDDLGVDFYIDESWKFDQSVQQEELIALIQSEGYGIIITDSLIRFFEGNENHSNEVSAFHRAIDAIRRKTGITWVMLQHLNKAGRDGASVAPGDRIRGSGEFKAHADVHIQLRGQDGTGAISTHVEKLRGRVKPADVVYRLDGNTMLDEPVVMTVLDHAAATLGAEHAALVYALELLEHLQPLTVGELLDLLKTRHNVAERTAQSAIAKGRKRGEIVVSHKEKNSVFLKIGRVLYDD